MARLFAASLTTSPLLLLPWGLKYLSANLPYSSNKHGLGPTTCCYIKLFHSQITLYMSRWFVTSLPTLPLCVVLLLGLLASPPTFPIFQTSMDLVPQLVVIFNFFTLRPHICQDYYFVTSLPTSPLCMLLPLGLHTSPPTFPIPQTSSDLVPQPPSCLYGPLFLHSVLSSTKLSRATTVSLFILWTNSYNVTILMKPLWKNFA